MNLQMLVGPDATPADPGVRKVGQADIKDALAKGAQDFLPTLDLLHEPLLLVALSITLAIISMCVITVVCNCSFRSYRVSLWLVLSWRLACTRSAGAGSSALTLPGRTFLIFDAPPRSP